MEWLSQNWIWLVVVGGVVWLLSRIRQGGSMGCCGAHEMAHEGPAGESKPQGANASRPPVKEEKTGQDVARPASSHRHGRGGRC